MVARNGAEVAEALAEAQKGFDERTARRSVIEPRTPEEGHFAPGYDLGNLVLWVGQQADEIEAWGRNVKRRDRQLREFIPTENVVAAALGTVVARNAAFDFSVKGPPRTAARVHDILENANNGKGWIDFIAKLSYDLYSQDSGAFFEILREGDSETAPLIGVNHLDASRCWHTGIPQEPVLYQDRLGRYHLMKWYQVQTLAELPAPHETLYGLQLCALTRLLRACQIIKAVNQYKYEKVSGRHTRAIHFIRGVPTQQINAALAQMQIHADQAGLSKYLQPIMIGTVDPAVDLQTATIEFLSLPDGYDEETTFKHYINQIALAFLEDYQTFAPLPGGNLGTSAQSQILHQKGQGKGPALFMKLMSTAFNQNVMPKNVEFAWEEQDVEAEKKEADVRAVRATTRAARIASGELTPEVARQIAKDEGDLDGAYLDALGQEDVTEDVELEDDRPTEAQIEEDEAGGAGSLSAQPAQQGPTPEQLQAVADAIKALSPLLLRNVAEGRKVQLGAFLQTRIHRAFTTAADDLAALGYMDTAGRIQLSGIIGDTLGTFARLVDEEAAGIALQELDRQDVRELVEQAAKALDHRATGMETAAERVPMEEEVAGKLSPVLEFLRSRIHRQLRAVPGRKARPGDDAVSEALGEVEEVLRLAVDQRVAHAVDEATADIPNPTVIAEIMREALVQNARELRQFRDVIGREVADTLKDARVQAEDVAASVADLRKAVTAQQQSRALVPLVRDLVAATLKEAPPRPTPGSERRRAEYGEDGKIRRVVVEAGDGTRTAIEVRRDETGKVVETFQHPDET